MLYQKLVHNGWVFNGIISSDFFLKIFPFRMSIKSFMRWARWVSTHCWYQTNADVCQKIVMKFWWIFVFIAIVCSCPRPACTAQYSGQHWQLFNDFYFKFLQNKRSTSTYLHLFCIFSVYKIYIRYPEKYQALSVSLLNDGDTKERVDSKS